MFRRAATRLLTRPKSAAAPRARPFSSAETPPAPRHPTPLWDLLMNMTDRVDPPEEPSSKLTVNFLVPNVTKVSIKEADKVVLPATTGEMSVFPGHEATMTELKPGVLSVHVGDNVEKYFVSSGYASINKYSFTNIISLGAVPLDQIDTNLVQKGLEEFTQKLSSASTELEKAEAQIGVDVHTALKAAVME